MVRIHFHKFQLSCDSLFSMNKWSKFKKKTLECIRLPGKKQFTSLFGMKKRQTQTVHFAYDTNGIPDPAAQSQMRLRKRSQSLPVNKFNPKFILVNRERTKLRYHHTRLSSSQLHSSSSPLPFRSALLSRQHAVYNVHCSFAKNEAFENTRRLSNPIFSSCFR